MLTTDYVPGSPIWIDLEARDIDAAARFYGAVFGWEFESAGPDAGGYGFLKLGERTVAAIGPLTEEGANPSWTVYFHSPDADATARAVEQAGGKVLFAPMDVFNLGRMAQFADPTGAQFAIWQPGENKGLDVVSDSNALCWTELYTTDAASAKTFYRTVFDWGLEDAPMPGVTYTIASPAGGGPDAGHGGIMELQPQNLEAGTISNWHPHFATEDCDATVAAAAEHGATVIMPPEDAPGVGRLAMLVDPFGALFALLKPNPRE
ncbi:MAG TPA: hydroxylase [Streptomyces sp.]|nr:hydroxylase [Streptomyces sp.]